MRKYFRLNSYCHLVDGADGGCIYNLATGDMIYLGGEKYNILRQCEENTLLADIPNYNVHQKFIENLYNQNLGMYFEEKVYVDKLSIGMPKSLSFLEEKFYHINSLYIELSNTCNFNCVFCPQNDNTLYRRTGCKRWDIKNRIKELAVWKEVVSQASKLSCQQLVFVGGEPFLQIHLLKEIIEFAVKNNIYKFLVFTNGSLLDLDLIRFIKAYNIELQIQILANTNELYENITKCSRVNDIIVDNIFLLNVNHINYNLMILVNSFNEDEIENIRQYYGRLVGDNKTIKLDFIYPTTGNPFFSKKYLAWPYDKKRSLRKTNFSNFCYTNKFHNCYANNLAISADGDVFPCIMSRMLPLGNILQDNIASIIRSSQYGYYRKLTKDNIESCKECSFRYGCFDCRAIEMYSTGKINGMEYCNIKPQVKNLS